MLKLTLLFLSISFLTFLSPTLVYSQEACPAGTKLLCTGGAEPDLSDGKCPASVAGGARINPTCLTTTPAAAVNPAGPPVATPCSGAGCTKGSGQQCSTSTGKIIVTGGDGVLTAIGCVPTKPQILVESILRYGTLAAGGVAFLLMLLAAIQMITAEGNPNTIKTSQEKFYSAIIGLLLVIFSVLLMQVIGVDLLGLQGFSR